MTSAEGTTSVTTERSVWRRIGGGAGALIALLVIGLGLTPAEAVALPELGPTSVVQVAATDCRGDAEVSACDADGDRIPDTVEREVCGTMTCADGTEDADGDGIPDWTEVLSCDTVDCASPTEDADKDGIPDFAERLVCGTNTCSNSTEDADGDGIGDWAEFVICGDRMCADGSEDYNGNGVSDADELAACVVRIDGLATTGWLLGGLIALAVALLAVGILARLRRSRRAIDAEETVDESGPPDQERDLEPAGVVPTGGVA